MFERLAPWLQENFARLWLFGLAWVVSFMAFGAWRRRNDRLPVFRPTFPGSLVNESWRSGGRGFVGANNCAWVSLLPDRLLTGLHFPFNLGIPRILLRWAGLDNDIPLTDIVAVDSQSFFGRQRLRITYRAPSGETSFWLDLKRPDVLREAIAAARTKSGPAATGFGHLVAKGDLETSSVAWTHDIENLKRPR